MSPKLTVCLVLLSLAVAVPARGDTIVTINNFNSATLNPNWVPSTLLNAKPPPAPPPTTPLLTPAN